MGILSWIAVGIVAGLLAKWIMPGDQKAGFFVTMVLGIVGALVGGAVMSLIGKTDMTTGFNLTTVLVATVGAIVVLVVYGFVRKSMKR